MDTEKELRTIHKGFRHPSVKATYHLLRKANVDGFNEGILNDLRKIQYDCKILFETCSNAKEIPLDLRYGGVALQPSIYCGYHI